MCSPTPGLGSGLLKPPSILRCLHSCTAAKSVSCAAETGNLVSSKRCTSSRRASNSDGPLLLPRGVCRNSGTPPPSRSSVLFGKPAAPPPAVGVFVFRAVASKVESELWFCPLSSVLSDERAIPSIRTLRLNGATGASRGSAISKIMSVSEIEAVNRRLAPC